MGTDEGAIYDEIGVGYKNVRVPDERIARRLHAALGDADAVVNVGAGVGSYEPTDRPVVAVEFSGVMIDQRPSHAAPAVRARAEDLPFADDAFGGSMAVLTLHHWSSFERGLREMCRVTSGNVVLLTWMGPYPEFWLLDYFPEVGVFDEGLFPDETDLERIMGPVRVEPLAIPFDCTDGFMCAYWRRPECYLDPDRRRAISTFAKMSGYEGALERLERDLESGAWLEKYGHVIDREEMDLGYRIVVREG